MVRVKYLKTRVGRGEKVGWVGWGGNGEGGGVMWGEILQLDKVGSYFREILHFLKNIKPLQIYFFT